MSNEVYKSKAEILESFGITGHQLTKFRAMGAPKAQGRGRHARWPLYELARWLLEEWPHHPQQDPEIRNRASAVLRGHKSPESGPEPETASDEQPIIPGEDELGLEGALTRLREAERRTYQLWIKALYDGQPDQNVHFQTWRQAVDLLRKAEGNLLQVLEQRRDLLPADEVKVWMSRQIEVAKSTLLDLPGKLAPSLENLPWSEIQKTLDEEIRHALSRLSDSTQ
ncbi:MAG: hypothetical protein U5L00_06740 [Desulfovermiculus sp.]|nr:hypothetical protein [Desulfovermiculus sp.]